MKHGNGPRRRRLRLSAAAVLAVAATGACSGSGSSTRADAAAAKTFTYWSMWKEDEPQAKVLRGALDSFQKDTGVKVTVVWQDRKVIDKTADAIAAHAPVRTWSTRATA